MKNIDCHREVVIFSNRKQMNYILSNEVLPTAPSPKIMIQIFLEVAIILKLFKIIINPAFCFKQKIRNNRKQMYNNKEVSFLSQTPLIRLESFTYQDLFHLLHNIHPHSDHLILHWSHFHHSHKTSHFHQYPLLPQPFLMLMQMLRIWQLQDQSFILHTDLHQSLPHQ